MGTEETETGAAAALVGAASHHQDPGGKWFRGVACTCLCGLGGNQEEGSGFRRVASIIVWCCQLAI